MDLALVALAVIVLARVLDIVALRSLAPDARDQVESALLQTRMLSLVALLVALVSGAVAYALAPDVPGHLVILGILVASILAQAVLGTVALVRRKVENRYVTVFLVSRLVSAGAVAFLLAG